MAAVKRTPPEILPLEEQETFRAPFPAFMEAEETEEDRAIENVLADLGGTTDAKVNVYLLEPGKASAFVGTFDPTNFSIEEIQRTYGPGDYQIHVRVDGKLRARRQIRIAAPKVSNLPMHAQIPSVDKAEISKLAEAMNAGFQSMANMLAQTVQSIAANQPKPKTTQEMLQEMMLMKQLIGGNEAPKSDMDMFMQGLNFAKEITPREGEPGTGEIIMEAIKGFGPMIAQAQERAKMVAPITPTHSHIASPQAGNLAIRQAGNMVMNVSTATETETETPPQPAQDDQMSVMRKMYLNLLLSNARADNDPVTYASMAIDLQGETAVLEFARNPQWFEMLCAELPEAANFREWFTEMRNAFFMLTEQPNPDIQTGIPTSPLPADAIPENPESPAAPATAE